MHNFKSSNRCELFNKISEEVWAKIIYSHRQGIDPSEIGVTKDIISIIRTHFNSISNFGIWANQGMYEVKFGSDIDIFVETSKNNFVWIAQQAKILKRDGRYHGLRDMKNGYYQWQLLENLQKLAKCKIMYLLFNGKDNFKHNDIDCSGNFDEKQYGCSLVEIPKIKKIALTTNSGKFNNPTFEELHPTPAEPWRKLACCKISITNLDLYSFEQIKSEITTYNLINADEGAFNLPLSFDVDERNALKIVNINNQVGRKPNLVIVIRRIS